MFFNQNAKNMELSMNTSEIQSIKPGEKYSSDVFGITIEVETASCVDKPSELGYVSSRIRAKTAEWNNKNRVSTAKPLEVFGNSFLFYSDNKLETCSWKKV